MCLIVYKEGHEAIFTNRQFKYMIANNPDGFGIMYREGGRVKFEKTLGGNKEKFKIFQAHRNRHTYAMHARIRTHGLIDEINCHPYEILSIDKGDPIDLYLMHNGQISAAPELDKTKSDTWHYVEYVLKPLIKADLNLFWENEYIQAMVQDNIGYSKLLFMRSDDVKFPVLILNYKAGTEKDNCWLSNSHSTEPRSYNVGGNYKHFRKPYEYNDNKTTHTATDKEVEEAQKAIENNTFDWEGYEEDKDKKLFLPKDKKDDKIIELKPDYSPIDIDADMLYVIKGMSNEAVKLFILEDKDYIANLIMSKYNKNTMDYDTIMKLIEDKNEIDGIVRLLKEMSVEEGSRIKSYR